MNTNADRNTDEATQRLEAAEGAHVYSADGEELGTLAAVGDGYFKVEVSMGPDYWLPFDAVARNEGNDVYLSLGSEEVDSRKLDDAAMDLSAGEVEAAVNADGRDSATERRYEGEANYGLHPRPRV